MSRRELPNHIACCALPRRGRRHVRPSPCKNAATRLWVVCPPIPYLPRLVPLCRAHTSGVIAIYVEPGKPMLLALRAPSEHPDLVAAFNVEADRAAELCQARHDHRAVLASRAFADLQPLGARR